MIEALVLEDQGEFARMKSNTGTVRGGPSLAPSRSYLSAGDAGETLKELDALSSAGEPIPNSAGMPVSDELKIVLAKTMELTDDTQRSQVQPLHILAATIATDTTGVARILVNARVSREDILTAIEAGSFD